MATNKSQDLNELAMLVAEAAETLLSLQREIKASKAALTPEEAYDRAIAKVERNLSKVNHRIEDTKEANKPLKPDDIDERSRLSKKLDDLKLRQSAEAAARKQFLAEWSKSTLFGLVAVDGEAAWKRHRESLMTSPSSEQLREKAGGSDLYKSL